MFINQPVHLSAAAKVFRGMLTRIDSDPVSLLPLLLTLSLVQGMLWLWAVFDSTLTQVMPTHALTQLGAQLYKPDTDMPIFGVGVSACVLLDALLVLLLTRFGGLDSRSLDPRVLLLGCGIVLFLPTLLFNNRSAFLLAFALGLAWVAWQLGTFRRGRNFSLPAAPALQEDGRPPTTGLPHSLFVPLAIVASLVFVPWPEALVWKSFAGDRFHHFDFYAMAPALAHAHGMRLGTDFYTQYGVGWPMVLHWLGATSGVAGYTTLVRLEILVGCVYFLMLFIFLRAWLRDAGHATVGLLAVLLLALFTDVGGDAKWLWPSSTIMRYVFDIAVFSVLLAHARSGAARLGPLAGGLLGLQWLFSSDVGVYLLVAFGVYLGSVLRLSNPERPLRSVQQFGLGALLGLSVVAGVGFTAANQGDFPGLIFWAGLLESIFVYGGGIANLPIAQALAHAPGIGLLLLAMLTMYARSLANGLSALVLRKSSADAPLRAAIAAYGLGTLMLFVGRSHEQNLMHVCIPFCLLATHSAASMVRSSTSGLHRPGLKLHWLLSIALVAAIWTQAYQVNYPNLANALLGPVVLTQSPSITENMLPTAAPEVASEFSTASDAIRRAANGGRHSVAVIGYHDTAYLMQAGVAPYFRYSPVLANLLFNEQTAEVIRRIETAPPDWIFIAVEQERTLYNASTADSVRMILDRIGQRYVRQGSAGHFQVFRKVEAVSQ